VAGYRSDLSGVGVFGTLDVEMLVDVPANADAYIFDSLATLVNESFSNVNPELVDVSVTLCGRAPVVVPSFNGKPDAHLLDFLHAASVAPSVLDTLTSVVPLTTNRRRLVIVVMPREADLFAKSTAATAAAVRDAAMRSLTRVIYVVANQSPDQLATTLNIDRRRILHVADQRMHLAHVLIQGLLDRIAIHIMRPLDSTLQTLNMQCH